MISGGKRTLSVVVKTVFFPRERFADERWCLFSSDMGKCAGKLPFYPRTGMRLRLTGSFGEYHGEKRFHFTAVEHAAPRGGKELLAYVGALAKGIGPKAVETVWAQYGEDWTESIDLMPPKYAIPLRLAYDSVSASACRMDVLRWVLANGGSPRIADLALKKWGRSTVAALTENPYLLCELDGVGFKTADAIAARSGTRGKMARACAAVRFAVGESMAANGDSVADEGDVYGRAHALGVGEDAAALAVARLVRSGELRCVGNGITTKSVVEHEGYIAQYIVEHDCETDAECRAEDFFTERQREAVERSVRRLGVSVINGGAGTGKTTTVKGLYEELVRRGERVSMCAFAGKAAARLRDATGYPARTIHSLLGSMGDAGFRCGSLEGETVIVDEASMVPSSLLYEIMRREPKRVVLVGDQAQLPPVGIGAPFHDIVEELPGLVTTLDKCHRASGAVLRAGEAVRNGAMPDDGYGEGERFGKVWVKGADAAHETILEWVRDGEVDFRRDVIVVPRNGEGEDAMPCSVRRLNDDIQRMVNPHADGERFRIGDRMMCTRNFPADDLWNGTCGWITRVDCDGVPYFTSDETGAETRLKPEQREAMTAAWTVTVHKAQGSQYDSVFCACLGRDAAHLFDRSMLYTAITRAKRQCFLVCDGGVTSALNSSRRRETYLARLIRNEA